MKNFNTGATTKPNRQTFRDHLHSPLGIVRTTGRFPAVSGLGSPLADRQVPYSLLELLYLTIWWCYGLIFRARDVNVPKYGYNKWERICVYVRYAAIMHIEHSSNKGSTRGIMGTVPYKSSRQKRQTTASSGSVTIKTASLSTDPLRLHPHGGG